MSEFQNKRPEPKEKSAVPAITRARDMLCDLSGPRGWNDTRESWLARGARRARLTLRRARAIFYLEPIKLTADEYVSIEAAFIANARLLDAAHAPLEAIADLARPAGLGSVERSGAQGRGPAEESETASRAERGSAVSASRPTG